MRKSRWLAAAVTAVTALTALTGAVLPAHASATKAAYSTRTAERDVCGPVKPGFARCMSIVRTDIRPHLGLFTGGSLPSGYGPADLQHAYRLPSGTAGTGQTVAIVTAYDDAYAESDLAVYRHQYGLPPCTTANGCFRKVAQDGTTSLPQAGGDFGGQLALEQDMVSAICPRCRILLVEANDNSLANLGAAVNEAVALGARFVAADYGTPDSQLTASDEADANARYYDHPGVVITAPAGDGGYAGGLSYPATSPDVIAVGGTTLTPAPGTSRGWSETAWGGTGSGCSASAAKPAWQHDTGCSNRTAVDVSAVADPSTGVAIYDTANLGWLVAGGTSTAAVIIASAYALAGVPSPVTNPASYPYADTAALNDVTSGSTGSCTPAYLCTAGPGYDGPTGLGTPDGVDAFGYGVPGSHGTLTGTVTATGTRKPLAGAQVSTGGYTAITDAAGHYQLAVVPGSHLVSVAAFGYATATVPGVQVTAGESVTVNAGLSPVPMETISGTVTDGSGHGWPLAAKLTVPGTPVTAWTNPATGGYSIKLPANAAYPVQIETVYAGYPIADDTVAVAATGLTRNFAVQVDGGTCTAPGYGTVRVMNQTFDNTTIPPGWSVTNFPDDGAGNTWRFDDPGGQGNGTGGTGNFAVAWRDRLHYNSVFDTALVTPAIDMSHVAAPVLGFNEWLSSLDVAGSVELSTDGGHTWTTVWSFGNGEYGPQQVSVALPQAAGKASVQLRFRLSGPPKGFADSTSWQVDNVTVSDCAPTPGGLLAGQVRDANTGQGTDAATVGTGQGQVATTTTVPGDPWFGPGSYWLFTGHTGSQPITVAASNYASATVPVTVTAGRVTAASFSLKAGRLAVGPGTVTAIETLGGHTTATVKVRNTGSAPATVSIDEWPGGTASSGPGNSPVLRVTGHFAVLPGSHGTARTAGQTPPPFTDATPWAALTGTPTPVFGSAAATDPVTGRVYLAGGMGTNWTSAFIYPNLWAYDPGTGRWSTLPRMRNPRFGPQAAFIAGKLYVTGGWDSRQNPMTQLEIYDPVSQTWATGTRIPHAYYAAATAVLNGKMYVIGGCWQAQCFGRTDVQVYDPATDRWTVAAPYPAMVSEQACGTIAGQIYCAGGLGSNNDGPPVYLSSGYAYNPKTNTWRPIASLPIDLWGSAYSAADGRLLLSGGITAQGTVMTNQGYAYDPVTDSWSALPNAPVPTYDAAGACGFYQFGGDVANFNGNIGDLVFPKYAHPGTRAIQLPGYGGCGGQDWVSAQPGTLTLAPGQSATITVTLSATSPAITQPGSYDAVIRFGGTTPYPAPVVPVTLTVRPPASWGEITGTIYGKSCSGGKAPLAGASVQIDGRHGTWSLSTDVHGRYALWLDAGNDPLTVITSMSGWLSQAAAVKVPAGGGISHQATLVPVSCG